MRAFIAVWVEFYLQDYKEVGDLSDHVLVIEPVRLELLLPHTESDSEKVLGPLVRLN